jgi:hypothetical protein
MNACLETSSLIVDIASTNAGITARRSLDLSERTGRRTVIQESWSPRLRPRVDAQITDDASSATRSKVRSVSESATALMTIGAALERMKMHRVSRSSKGKLLNKILKRCHAAEDVAANIQNAVPEQPHSPADEVDQCVRISGNRSNSCGG